MLIGGRSWQFHLGYERPLEMYRFAAATHSRIGENAEAALQSLRNDTGDRKSAGKKPGHAQHGNAQRQSRERPIAGAVPLPVHAPSHKVDRRHETPASSQRRAAPPTQRASSTLQMKAQETRSNRSRQLKEWEEEEEEEEEEELTLLDQWLEQTVACVRLDIFSPILAHSPSALGLRGPSHIAKNGTGHGTDASRGPAAATAAVGTPPAAAAGGAGTGAPPAAAAAGGVTAAGAPPPAAAAAGATQASSSSGRATAGVPIEAGTAAAAPAAPTAAAPAAPTAAAAAAAGAPTAAAAAAAPTAGAGAGAAAAALPEPCNTHAQGSGPPAQPAPSAASASSSTPSAAALPPSPSAALPSSPQAADLRASERQSQRSSAEGLAGKVPRLPAHDTAMPPLLLFLFAADSSLTRRAINAAGWAEQMQLTRDLARAHVVVATRLSRSGRRIGLQQGQDAAASHQLPFVCVGRKMTRANLQLSLSDLLAAHRAKHSSSSSSSADLTPEGAAGPPQQQGPAAAAGAAAGAAVGGAAAARP